MARRYDSRTTTFSPDGRLFQVEYAKAAIDEAGSTLGIVCKDHVCLFAEKRTNKLLENIPQKIFMIDDHVTCAVAGITADANILIHKLRHMGQQYRFTYGEPMPLEQLVTGICDVKQGYTQFGGLRPFGVSFLVAGYDSRNGIQLLSTDPSGNYSSWDATAIGAKNQTAFNTLKDEYKKDMELDDALKLALRILKKTVDTTELEYDKLEMIVGTKTQDGCYTSDWLAEDVFNRIKDSLKADDDDTPMKD